MLLYFIYLLLNSTFSQEWIPYYEDDKISISYTSKVCDDRQNGFDFEYYLIRVTNRTDQTLVINFNKSAEEVSKEEDKLAFVLAPAEIKTGSCDYDPVKLRVFKADRRSNKTARGNIFALSKINVIKVY